MAKKITLENLAVMISEKFSLSEKSINTRFNSSEKRMEETFVTTDLFDRHMTAIANSFNQVYDSFYHVNQKVDQLAEFTFTLNQKVDQLTEFTFNLNKKVDQLTEFTLNLNQKVNMLAEVTSGLNHNVVESNKKLDDLSESFKVYFKNTPKSNAISDLERRIAQCENLLV